MDTPEKCTPSDPQSQTVGGGWGGGSGTLQMCKGNAASLEREKTRGGRSLGVTSVHPRFRRVFAKLSVHGCQETRFAPWERSV